MKEEKQKKEYDIVFIHSVLRAMWTEQLSYKKASLRFEVPHQTISSWARKHQDREEMILSSNPIQMDMKTDDKEQQIANLKKAIEVCNVHIASLETMIELAEKTFKIEIRKKSGTKQ